MAEEIEEYVGEYLHHLRDQAMRAIHDEGDEDKMLAAVKETLDVLKELKDVVAITISEIELEVGKRCDWYSRDVDGIGRVTIQAGSSTSWGSKADRAETLREVIERRRVDPKTGEYEDMASFLMKTCSIPGFQKTGLEFIGMDPDEYSTTERKPRRVRFS